MVVMQDARAFARFFVQLSKSRVGMDVARFGLLSVVGIQGFSDRIKKEISTCFGQFW